MRTLFLCAALAGCGPATMSGPDSNADAPDGAAVCSVAGSGVVASGRRAIPIVSCARAGAAWVCGTPSYASPAPAFCNPGQTCATFALSFRANPLAVQPGTALAIGTDVSLDSLRIGDTDPRLDLRGPYTGDGTARRTDDPTVTFVVRAALRSADGECISIDVDATLYP